jgi:hypothetical protein
VVAHADLKILDPTFTTAYISRNFGYMVYDTLFAQDATGKPQPQMVEKYTTSKDGKQWSFTLRPGLKFSDGSRRDLGRRRGLAAALGRARQPGPRHDRGGRRVEGHRCAQLHAHAQASPSAWCSTRWPSPRAFRRWCCPSASPSCRPPRRSPR